MDVIESLMGALLILAIVVIIVVIAIFIIIGVFVNKFHKLVYQKGTALAFIPFTQGYMIGKLAFNRLIGWVVVAATLLTSSYSTTVNGETVEHHLLPGGNIVSILRLALLIYAIVKYYKVKNGKIQPATAAASSDKFGAPELIGKLEQAAPQAPTPEVPQATQTTPTGAVFCTNCGAQIPNDSQYCQSCGTQRQ